MLNLYWFVLPIWVHIGWYEPILVSWMSPMACGMGGTQTRTRPGDQGPGTQARGGPRPGPGPRSDLFFFWVISRNIYGTRPRPIRVRLYIMAIYAYIWLYMAISIIQFVFGMSGLVFWIISRLGVSELVFVLCQCFLEIGCSQKLAGSRSWYIPDVGIVPTPCGNILHAIRASLVPYALIHFSLTKLWLKGSHSVT